MRLIGTLFLVILATIRMPVHPAHAGDWIQRFPQAGGIDWCDGTVTATGMARPGTRRSRDVAAPGKVLSYAKVAAQNHLLDIVKQIRISSAARAKTIAAADPMVMARIQALIKKAALVKQSYLSDGTVTVTLSLSMGGALNQLVLPREVAQIDSVTPITASTAPDGENPAAPRWTGLVVDARDLAVRPALVPQIIDTQGLRVYGSEFISRESAVRWGGCGYMTRIDSRCAGRIGSRPLTIRGIGVQGPGQTDIIISTEDAARIRAAAEHVSFMRQARVIILVDPVELKE